MSVGWNTYGKLNQSCVAYGTSASSLTSQNCNTNQTTYGTSRTYFHAVTLTGLTPATTYYYKIGSTNSSVEHFVSPRLPGDTTPFNIDVVVDLGPAFYSVGGDQDKLLADRSPGCLDLLLGIPVRLCRWLHVGGIQATG